MKHAFIALALAVTLAASASFSASAAPPAAAATEPIRVVYHINESEKARGLLGNVFNHLRDDPTAKIVVVAHGGGIDFLLKDAVDRSGSPYVASLAELGRQGVSFKVCRNTLTARNLTDSAVAKEASVVPAGVAEIARLQAREGYVYVKP
jgi:hypothetical protein